MKRLGMPVSDTTILAGLRKYAGARSAMASTPSSPAYFGVLLERRWAEGITKVRSGDLAADRGGALR